jgi:DNA-binding NtrC family response regulator
MENTTHRPQLDTLNDKDKPLFISNHLLIRDLLKRAAMVARSDASVLITGESGTGKEVLARYIHDESQNGNFVAVNCAALPRDVIDNELFGHEKEAFTGAVSKKPGCFEMAHQGTLFLDEIAEMQPQVQAKLLRAIESKRFRRLGGTEEIEVDVRILSATNRNIPEAIASGSLREDVYYRLGVVEFILPPLRERKSDIPVLLEHFATSLSAQYGKPPLTFSRDSLEILTEYRWPGNVRELRNIVESLMITSAGSVVEPHDLPERLAREHSIRTAITIPIGSTIEDVEWMMIEHTLRAAGGNKSKAALILGVSRKYLYDKLRDRGRAD